MDQDKVINVDKLIELANTMLDALKEFGSEDVDKYEKMLNDITGR